MMGNIIFITNQTKKKLVMQLQSGLFSVSEVFLSLLCSCKQEMLLSHKIQVVYTTCL